MNCELARLEIGADPAGSTPELDAHVVGCDDCTGYRREMRKLEGDLRRALAWPTPDVTTMREVDVVPLRPARRWALAASVLLAGVLAASWFALPSRDALASGLVAHLSEEPEAWSQRQPVPGAALDRVLRRAGVRLERAVADEVVYASSCFLRGRYLPHLVVATPTGPVTVIVLRGEKVARRVAFDEGGYAGVLLPVPGGGGGIAVLARDASPAGGSSASTTPDVAVAAARVLAAVQFDDTAAPAAARP